MGMSERPGIMFYFSDWRGVLNLGDDAALGRFVRAALEYGLSGTDTTFQGIERAVWDPLKARIDRDGERYQRRREAGEYAVYCREEKRAGRAPLEHSEWSRCQSLSIDNDFIHTHTHTQSQSHSHTQPQTGGDTVVHATAHTTASGKAGTAPLNEQEFEQRREALIKLLEEAKT